MLAAARELPLRLRARSWGPTGRPARSRARIAGIVGAGAVGAELIRLLGALGVDLAGAHAQRARRARSASAAFGPDGLGELLREQRLGRDRRARHAAHAPPDRRAGARRDAPGRLARQRLARLHRRHRTRSSRRSRPGTIGGAALDVTDPEPLPDGHPLWGLPNVIITPHVAATPSMNAGALCARVAENVEALRARGRRLDRRRRPRRGLLMDGGRGMFADLTGRTALVTGAGRPGSMGAGIAAVLVRQGARVALADIDAVADGRGRARRRGRGDVRR